MSTFTILIFAIVVFILLLAGLALSAYEFMKLSDDPSKIKGVRPAIGDPRNSS